MFGFSINEVSADILDEWKRDGQAFRLVDVRSPAETAQGIIPGAELMPLHLVPLRKDELRSVDPVVIYCRTGARSAQACAFLAQQGHDNVHNLAGGIVAWARAAKPIVAA
jgi:rhodanese-related sulfurtransferase